MKIEILNEGAFASALVRLQPDETFVSDSGAMFRASSNVDIDVTTQSRGGGGIFAGLKRLLSGETFFLSTYRTTDGRPGEVGLAPTHLGEVRILELNGDVPWICAGGSFLGAASRVALDTQYQGLKGIFSSSSLLFLRAKGAGPLIVCGYGRLVEIDVRESLIVDTGHVVAFEESLKYSIGKAGGSWLQTFLSGEGLVLHFEGSGKVLVQSHNTQEFGQLLGPLLPERS
jgi:uncharacterized protein (TIGR00266 family)